MNNFISQISNKLTTLEDLLKTCKEQDVTNSQGKRIRAIITSPIEVAAIFKQIDEDFKRIKVSLAALTATNKTLLEVATQQSNDCTIRMDQCIESIKEIQRLHYSNKKSKQEDSEQNQALDCYSHLTNTLASVKSEIERVEDQKEWQQARQAFSEAWQEPSQEEAKQKQTLLNLRQLAARQPRPECLTSSLLNILRIDPNYLVKIQLTEPQPVDESTKEPVIATYYFDSRELDAQCGFLKIYCMGRELSNPTVNTSFGVLSISLPRDQELRVCCLVIWQALALKDNQEIIKYFESMNFVKLSFCLKGADLMACPQIFKIVDGLIARWLVTDFVKYFSENGDLVIPEEAQNGWKKAHERIVSCIKDSHSKIIISKTLIHFLFTFSKTCPDTFIETPTLPQGWELLKDLMKRLQDTDRLMDALNIRDTTTPTCIPENQSFADLMRYFVIVSSLLPNVELQLLCDQQFAKLLSKSKKTLKELSSKQQWLLALFQNEPALLQVLIDEVINKHLEQFFKSSRFRQLPPDITSFEQLKLKLPPFLSFLVELTQPFIQKLSLDRNVLNILDASTNLEYTKKIATINILFPHLKNIFFNDITPCIVNPAIEHVSIHMPSITSESFNEWASQALQVKDLFLTPNATIVRSKEQPNLLFPPNLQSLTLSTNNFTKADWQELGKLRHLRSLCSYGEQPYEHFTHLNNLEEMSINTFMINVEKMKQIVTNTPHLRRLHLNFHFLSNDERDVPRILSPLSNHTLLDHLTIETHDPLSVVEPIELPAMQLKKLIVNCPVKDFTNVQQTLTHLVATPRAMKSISFESLSKCPHLHTLILYQISLEEMKLLDQIPNLKRVFTIDNFLHQKEQQNRFFQQQEWLNKKYTLTPLPIFYGKTLHPESKYHLKIKELRQKLVNLALEDDDNHFNNLKLYLYSYS